MTHERMTVFYCLLLCFEGSHSTMSSKLPLSCGYFPRTQRDPVSYIENLSTLHCPLRRRYSI